MYRTETIGGFIKQFIRTNLLLSERFYQESAPLVSTDTTYDKIEKKLSRFFKVDFSPYQFLYFAMNSQPSSQNTIKQYKHVLYHPLGLINFNKKNTDNDFKEVKAQSFVHSLDLVNIDWKMDEFELDDVQTVASEYDLDHSDDLEQLSISLTSSGNNQQSMLCASAAF